MLWKLTQSNALFTGRKVPWKSSMRVFSLFAFFLVGLSALPFSVSAEDSTNGVFEVLAPLTLDDLDPDTRSAVVGLATSMAGDRATSATIDDNVQTILTILSGVRRGGTRYDAFRTVPFAVNNQNSATTLWAMLNLALADVDFSAASTDLRQYSYLRLIHESIFPGRIVPSSGTALLPTVWKIENALSSITNNLSSSSVDMSWTNALPALVSASTNLNAFFDGARDIFSELQTFGHLMANFFAFFPGSNLNDIRLDTADINSILSTYVASWDDAYDSDDQSWRVQLTYDGGLGDRIGEIAGSISDSNDDTVDALNGIRDLLRMISTNVAATHDDIYGASQEESNIAGIAIDGADDYDYAVDTASDDLSDTMDLNEPDYEVHYTQNPLDPLVNAVDFTQTMRSKLPDMSTVQTDSRVYLFKTEWDREHLLTRPGGSSRSGSGLGQGLSEISFDLSGSDPHVPNELLSYAATAMAWAWNLAAAVTAFYLFRQFWDWVASWRV